MTDAQAMRAGYNYLCTSNGVKHYCETHEQAKAWVKKNGGIFHELCWEFYE